MVMVVMMVVVVMPVAVVMVVMMMVMVVILRELHARRVTACALLFIHRLQQRAGIGDWCQQVGVGIGLQHLARRRKRRGVTRRHGAERGNRAQKSGDLLVQSFSPCEPPRPESKTFGQKEGSRPADRAPHAVLAAQHAHAPR